MGVYDRPFWDSIQARRCALQRCGQCGTFRYPPGPVCGSCLSLDSEWTPISGCGEIVSWVRFHKQYLPAFPIPYEVIAVRLAENPVMISTLAAPPSDGRWIGRAVTLTYHRRDDGLVLPCFTLAESGRPEGHPDAPLA